MASVPSQSFGNDHLVPRAHAVDLRRASLVHRDLEVAEGEFSNCSAQGKSGNTAPDHKEQNGRSNIGRQGMSDGETTICTGPGVFGLKQQQA